jgi:hypothetical protein
VSDSSIRLTSFYRGHAVKNDGEEATCVQPRLHHSLFTIHYSRLLKLVGKGGGKRLNGPKCLTFMTKKLEVSICLGSGERTQVRKFLLESSCFQKVSGTNCMTELYQASLTWFFRSIKLLYLFMDVSGMGMMGVSIS